MQERLRGAGEAGEYMYIYRCEDTLESIFTAIYKVYEDHHHRDEVLLALEDEPRLFSTVIPVAADPGRSAKVICTLIARFGEENYKDLCLALAAPDPDKAQAVYGTVANGIRMNSSRGHLFDALSNPEVCRAFKLSRAAGRENCHLRGFTRFEELKNGILYSSIEPKNHLLPFLMPHFSDRFPQENFILHDVGRGIFGVHPVRQHSLTGEAGLTGDWYLVKGDEFLAECLEKSDSEEKYQMLFKCFCSSIAIKERHNIDLQRNMLPIHFREFMTEFH